MSPNSLPRAAMLAIALIQGLLLLYLYRAGIRGDWPSGAPLWAFPIWTLVISVPLLLLLSIERDNVMTMSKRVVVFAGLLALLALYTGWQAEPFGEFPINSLTAVFVISVAIGSFKALMYLQHWARGEPLRYERLFTYSWRNFLVGLFAGLFTVVFWLILVLWGQLFKVIGIDFFADLFAEDWFLIPVSAVIFGTGVSIFRDLTRVIDNITKLLHWLTKLLLPLLLFVAVVFLSALPFTGLALLWNTGRGTALLLLLLAMVLFFTNAVYQDGREANPYPRLLHRVIYCGLCIMPAVAALAFYGLRLRIQQYGWTVERCWAAVVWLLLSLFAIGYCIGILRRRDTWTTQLAAVNTGMGLVVLALMLLANSPILDFRKISIASQLMRVETGETRLDEFDFWYAKNELARPGYLAVEAIREEFGADNPELLALIDAPYRNAVAVPAEAAAFWEKLRYRPDRFEIPLDLKPLVQRHARMALEQDPVLFRVDLNGDGDDEYLLLLVNEYGVSFAQFYYRGGDTWRLGDARFQSPASGADARRSILDGDVRPAEPRFRNLSIGGIDFQPIARD